jgi:hypothetical protein
MDQALALQQRQRMHHNGSIGEYQRANLVQITA